MCGIIGILKPRPANELKFEIENLIPYLEHRGPDGWGSYASSGLGLGQTRLSIIDLSSGDQPMVSDRSVLVFNGEIFNYIELREELSAIGEQFRTSSDTEVLQRSIDVWGKDALSRLNGQFSLLYWDKKTRTLTAARDRYGIRPLYFMEHNGAYYFASEMKVFDHIGARTRYWNPSGLMEHGLVWNTLDNETVFRKIYSLEGGSFQEFKFDEISEAKRYYTLGENVSSEDCNSLNLQIETFRDKLENSVRLRLRSDVPVGCYLSGGIDSSVTSYLAKKINNKQFKSFSVTFSDGSFDESEYQNIMVDTLGFNHYSVNIDYKDIEDNFYNAARHFERPVFRTAPVPLYLLSRKVREEDVKVVLTGEAADEILFGYDTNKELKLLSQWNEGLNEEKVVEILYQLYPHLDYYRDKDQVGFLKMYYEEFLSRIDSPLAGLIVRVNNNQIISKMFNKDWDLNFDFDNFANKIDNLTPKHVKDWDIYRKNQYWEMKTLLSGYLLSSQGDRMAMANSIEGRFPFLDHNLIEWLLTLPGESKLNGFSAKFLLKEAYKDVIPAKIINRPKRPYMAPDILSFFPNGKRGLLIKKYLNSDIISEYGIYDPRMVERLLFKIERRGVDSSGYRDNMLISFILSNQIIEEQIRSPEKKLPDFNKQTVNVIEE